MDTQNVNFNREMDSVRIRYERDFDNLHRMMVKLTDDYIKQLIELKEVELKHKLLIDVAIENDCRQDDTLLTIQDASKYLNLSKAYIYQLTSKRLISSQKFGKKLWFRLSDLRKFRAGQWMGSPSQIADEYIKQHPLSELGKKKNTDNYQKPSENNRSLE